MPKQSPFKLKERKCSRITEAKFGEFLGLIGWRLHPNGPADSGYYRLINSSEEPTGFQVRQLHNPREANLEVDICSIKDGRYSYEFLGGKSGAAYLHCYLRNCELKAESANNGKSWSWLTVMPKGTKPNEPSFWIAFHAK